MNPAGLMLLGADLPAPGEGAPGTILNTVVAILVLLAILGVIVFVGRQRRRRHGRALEAAAGRLGLQFRAEAPEGFDKTLAALKPLHRGFAQRPRNVIHGKHRGESVVVCEVDVVEIGMATRGHVGGRVTETTGQCHALITQLPHSFPTLAVVPHAWFNFILGAKGFEDVPIDSPELARRYWIKTTDTAFAREVATEKVLRCLARAPEHGLLVHRNRLTLLGNDPLRPDALGADLDRLVALRRTLPDSLFHTSPARHA